MKAFGTMFVGGVVSFLLLKLFGSLMGPIAGVLLGFLTLAFKIGMFALVGFVLYRIFRRRRDAPHR